MLVLIESMVGSWNAFVMDYRVSLDKTIMADVLYVDPRFFGGEEIFF